MVDRLLLSRAQLAKIIGNDPEAIKQFEKLFSTAVSQETGIDEVAVIAGTADSKASQALAELQRIADALEFQGMADTKATQALDGAARINDYLRTATSDKVVFVTTKSDFPAPSGGVITLADNYTYFIAATVDLTGDRLVAGQNTAIIGGSSENCRIKSTGLVGTALLSSAWSLPLRNITLEANIALNLDATANANQALDWMGINFTDCATVGTIKSYNNFIMADGALLNSSGLTFDGTIGTVGFSQCLFVPQTGGTAITIPSTATVSRRFRIIYSAFVVTAGMTGVNVSASASVPVEGHILDTVNFSGGGTYTAGVAYSDNKALWVNCRGIINSATIGFMTMQANATATTVSATSTYYKIAGTTTGEAITQKFTHTSNRLTYDGAITRDFKITATASLTSGNNQELGLRIAVNGTTVSNSTAINTTSGVGKAEGAISQTVVQLAQNDYVEAFVRNNTAATDVTATYLSVIVEALT